MLYPQHLEEKIGFDRIRALLKDECHTSLGAGHVDSISFSADADVIRLETGRTIEFMALISEGFPQPATDEPDLKEALARIRTEGAYLMPEELYSLRICLLVVGDWLKMIHSGTLERFGLLVALAEGLKAPGPVIEDIDSILDQKGGIRDQASPQLALIRQKIRQKIAANEKTIGKILSAARSSGWSSPDAEITLRDGRLVIPLSASNKKKIKGVVHDESATGQTVYLEPESCIEINNEVRELEGEEKREIIRILKSLADKFRPDIGGLAACYDFLGTMDFVRSKARFGLQIGAHLPQLVNEQLIHWNNAYHPLLLLSHRQKGMTVVPLDISLDKHARILIISGPNAGGKSVCLKTIGLLQYMVQCGLPVPVDPDSEIGVFADIMIDIGDQQSLEQDLSTYSSHLININHFIRNAGPSTLFLIDEFGSGTDPSLGGAIAEAALEKLNESGAFGVVTTHYANLKSLAGNRPGILNGAMLFDTRNLQPLYRLITGKPGSSFTFEIAEKTGMDKEILEKASHLVNRSYVDFDRKLQELEFEKTALDKQRQEFEVADRFLSEIIAKYERLTAELNQKRVAVLEKARSDAARLLDDSNRLIENTIREIREQEAEKEKTREIRKKFEKQKKSLQDNAKEQSGIPVPVAVHEPFKSGDWVNIKEQNKAGRILRIRGEDAVVDFNGIHFTLSADKLEKSDTPPESAKSSGQTGRNIVDDLNQRAANFRLTLDLRGRKMEEAILLAQKYLDDALLVGMKELSILHGKGDGILRMAIRKLLSGMNEVESFADEHPERGGSGITRVILK